MEPYYMALEGLRQQLVARPESIERRERFLAQLREYSDSPEHVRECDLLDNLFQLLSSEQIHRLHKYVFSYLGKGIA